MQSYEIAHLNVQGQDVIIVFMASSYGSLSAKDQEQVYDHLQHCAEAAGLAGSIVIVWKYGQGYRFLAPKQWHSWLQSISWDALVSNINKTLTCSC